MWKYQVVCKLCLQSWPQYSADPNILSCILKPDPDCSIDFLLLVAPLASGVLFAILEVVRNESFKQPFLTYILLGVSSTIILFFLFTFLEGKFGRTPGKWILRIQVLGTDLKPCGFGRAFIRNLLKFVDGFFNFMVCIILISLTENWQRVGDMVARTIVIRKPLKWLQLLVIPIELFRWNGYTEIESFRLFLFLNINLISWPGTRGRK